MPTRDEQDYERKRQRIMDGALQVFASKGFEKATNRDVARAAGIKSPGLIYHYFKDKSDLLVQAMQRHVPTLDLLLNQQEALMQRPPREVLTALGSGLLAITENPAAIAVLKVLLSESARRPGVAAVLNVFGPRRGITFLSRYLARQMEAGTMRRMDPGAAARCFAGPIIAYILTRSIFPQDDAASLDTETMLRCTVDVFLRGMEVEIESAASGG